MLRGKLFTLDFDLSLLRIKWGFGFSSWGVLGCLLFVTAGFLSVAAGSFKFIFRDILSVLTDEVIPRSSFKLIDVAFGNVVGVTEDRSFFSCDHKAGININKTECKRKVYITFYSKYLTTEIWQKLKGGSISFHANSHIIYKN